MVLAGCRACRSWRPTASPPAGLSTASSGEVKGLQARPLQGADIIFIMPVHQSGAPASRRACSRVSAMCQESSTRQLAQRTVVPCFLRFASSGEAPLRQQRHRALRRHRAQRNDADAVFAGQHLALATAKSARIPRTASQPATSGRILHAGVVHGEPVVFHGDPLAVEQQQADHHDRLVLAVALRHRIDPELYVRRKPSAPGPKPKMARPPVM